MTLIVKGLLLLLLLLMMMMMMMMMVMMMVCEVHVGLYGCQDVYGHIHMCVSICVHVF